MRSSVVEELGKQQIIRPALGPMLTTVTHRIRSVEVEHHLRLVGRSGYTPRRLIQQSLSNVIGYSVLPLRLLAIVGALGVFASLAIAVNLLFRYASDGIAVPGFMTQTLLIVSMFGLNLFAFGVIGEYVFRIFQFASGRSAFSMRQEMPDCPGAC